jgi:hypothetical protein
MGNIFKIKRRNALAGAAAFDPTRVNLSQSGGSDNGYKIGDKVMYQGNYYVATANNDAIPPTDGLGVYWSLLGPALGAPATIAHGELAFNEVGEAFYYGKAGNASSSIGGKGEFLDKSTSQTVSGNKTFSANLVLSSAVTITQVTTASDTHVSTTEFVQNVFSLLDGGNFDVSYLYFWGNNQQNGYYLWSDISNWYSDANHQNQAASLPISSSDVMVLSTNDILIDLDTEGYVNVNSIHSNNSTFVIYSDLSANFVASVHLDSTSVMTFSGNATNNL